MFPFLCHLEHAYHPATAQLEKARLEHLSQELHRIVELRIAPRKKPTRRAQASKNRQRLGTFVAYLGWYAKSLQVWANDLSPPRPKPKPPQRMNVDVNKCTVELDRKTYAVTPDQAAWLSRLIIEGGGWVSSSAIEFAKGSRPRIDRLKKRLPQQLQAVIESKTGAGYRVTVFD